MNIHDIKIKIFYHVVEIQILDELRKNEILSFLSWKSGCDLKNLILKDHAGKSPLKKHNLRSHNLLFTVYCDTA